MVENQFLERLNTLMQHVLNNERPFGGKQVIFVARIKFHPEPFNSSHLNSEQSPIQYANSNVLNREIFISFRLLIHSSSASPQERQWQGRISNPSVKKMICRKQGWPYQLGE